MTTLEIAQKVGISNGSAYYLLKILIDKGFVRVSKSKQESKKTKYTYLLTTKGLREKSLSIKKFIDRKKQE